MLHSLPGTPLADVTQVKAQQAAHGDEFPRPFLASNASSTTEERPARALEYVKTEATPSRIDTVLRPKPQVLNHEAAPPLFNTSPLCRQDEPATSGSRLEDKLNNAWLTKVAANQPRHHSSDHLRHGGPDHAHLRHPFLPRQMRKRPTLVLDLDGTLICSREDHDEDITFEYYIDYDDGQFVFVWLRPGLRAFLEAIRPHFEVVLWTAANRQWADRALDQIDSRGSLFDHRLYREHTTRTQDWPFLKDLANLGRDMSQVILVDDNPAMFSAQPENAVWVLPYDRRPHDDVLPQLRRLLLQVLGVPDVRPALRSHACLHATPLLPTSMRCPPRRDATPHRSRRDRGMGKCSGQEERTQEHVCASSSLLQGISTNNCPSTQAAACLDPCAEPAARLRRSCGSNLSRPLEAACALQDSPLQAPPLHAFLADMVVKDAPAGRPVDTSVAAAAGHIRTGSSTPVECGIVPLLSKTRLPAPHPPPHPGHAAPSPCASGAHASSPDHHPCGLDGLPAGEVRALSERGVSLQHMLLDAPPGEGQLATYPGSQATCGFLGGAMQCLTVLHDGPEDGLGLGSSDEEDCSTAFSPRSTAAAGLSTSETLSREWEEDQQDALGVAVDMVCWEGDAHNKHRVPECATICQIGTDAVVAGTGQVPECPHVRVVVLYGGGHSAPAVAPP